MPDKMKSDKTRQLTLDLPSRAALGRDDFFQSAANEMACAMLDGDWQGQNRLILTGPSGAGKTHLSRVWALENDAIIVEHSELADMLQRLLDNRARPCVVEDVQALAGHAASEEPLFHLLNDRSASGGALLLTHLAPVTAGRFALPDLASRIASLPVAAIEAPDDQLLMMVLVKLFADRQLDVPAEVIGYLSRHIERSFQAAGRAVAALDQAALAQKRAITRPLAASVLQRLYG